MCTFNDVYSFSLSISSHTQSSFSLLQSIPKHRPPQIGQILFCPIGWNVFWRPAAFPTYDLFSGVHPSTRINASYRTTSSPENVSHDYSSCPETLLPRNDAVLPKRCRLEILSANCSNRSKANYHYSFVLPAQRETQKLCLLNDELLFYLQEWIFLRIISDAAIFIQSSYMQILEHCPEIIVDSIH